jgi:hypothetical protein
VVTIRIPVPSSLLVSNLLGVFGLLGIVFAIGALTSWPWALLAAGLFAVTISVIAQAAEPASPAAVTPLRAARRERAA